MQDPQFKTSKTASHRPAEASFRRLTKWHDRTLRAAGRAGVLCVLLCGSVTGARAQAISNPNQIYGTISWNNPPGPVLTYLNSSTHGLAGGLVYARDVGGLYVASKLVADDPSFISAPYSIDVQAGTISGIQHNVSPQMFTSDGNTYWFATALSGGVVFPPALPDVLLDFTECAGLLDVQFCDATGSPVVVGGGFVSADVQSSGARQAEDVFANVSTKRLAVRGGNTFSVEVTLYARTIGTDPFFDQFTIPAYTTNYTVAVSCDQIVTVKFIVPPSPIGPGGGGPFGKIIGIADVLGKEEHWVSPYRTLVYAFDGPLNNFRYANIRPLTQPGYQPCAVVSPSPVVGTLSCNSAGPYCLTNLLPSNFSTPPRDYGVVASFYFNLNRRYEFFGSPIRSGVTVPSIPPGAPVDLGNTFVINPGFVKGDIFLCGPEEGTNANSCLRYIYRASDSDGDGIPDAVNLDQSSYLGAFGSSQASVGATYSANGGIARVLFEGGFVASGPDKNHFVGDYIMTLGGLNQETKSRWNQQSLYLEFQHGTPDYISSLTRIDNPQFSDVEIVAGQCVTNNHRYGFSDVTITFHANNGTLFSPIVGAGGSFNGVNFEGQQTHYDIGVPYAYGLPNSLATATPDGQVRVCIPEGTYTFYPTVESVNPDGVTSTHNTLLPFTLPVPPCQKITACPGLQMTVTNLPMCATNRLLHVTGTTTSHTNVTIISYVLNGGAPVTVCNNCGVSPSFSFNVTLVDCLNTLKVTAVDADGCVASVESTIKYDLTPPVLSGCTNISTNSLAGTNGNVVSYSVTALDNCDGVLPVTYVPPTGSFFPSGQTVVTCTAADHCGNTNSCQFTVTIGSECLGPVAWWPMNGSVTDIAGANQPSATAALSFVPGQIGQGVTFPQFAAEVGHIEIPHAPALDNQRFTFEAWVRPDGIGPNADSVGSVILVKNRDGGFYYGLSWRADGKFAFGTGPTGVGEIIYSFHNFPAGCFYHVVGTYDGVTFNLFVNGVLEGQRASSAPLDYSGSLPWVIGATALTFRNQGFPRTWNGVIDEVKIWCRPLSAPEIQATYLAGGPVDCPCLRVANEHLACATNVPGKLNYSFDLFNNTGVPVKYLFLVPKTNCFTMMPNVITLQPPLAPGQTANLSVMINLTGDCPTNLCFLLAAHDSNLVHCCSIMHCIDRDTTGPRLVSAVPDCGGNKITVTFDKPLAPTSVLGIPNFVVDDLAHQISLAFASTSFGADFQTVCLFTTAPLSASTQYQLTVNNVTNDCGNVIAQNSQARFGCTNCVEPPEGLVNWWTFDEKAGTSAHDIAGVRDNIGTLNSFGMNPPTHVPGKVRNALHFNGTSQWMEVSKQNEVDFLGTCFPATDGESFTIGTWIKPDQATGTAMLLDKRDSTLRGYTVSLVNGFLRVELNTPNVRAYQGTSFLAANQWHFIAISYERCANVLRMYVDGSLTPVDTFTTPVLGDLANNEKLFVGRQRGPLGPPNFFAGCLDELEFFKRVLTDAEIHSIWTADSAGQCKPGANLPRYKAAATSVVAGQLTIAWSGSDAVLQSADILNGSLTIWTDVESATSGFRPDMADPKKFYRLIYR